MKLILYRAPFALTEIDFVPGPFRCWIEQQDLVYGVPNTCRFASGSGGLGAAVAAVAVPPQGCVEGAAAWRFRRRSSLSHACALLWGGGRPGVGVARALEPAALGRRAVERHIVRVPTLPAQNSAPGAAMGTTSASATPEPLHRLQPLSLAHTEMTSGNPNQTCPAPTARPATPGRGCHRSPRPTFAVTVQEHLNSTQDHQKVPPPRACPLGF